MHKNTPEIHKNTQEYTGMHMDTQEYARMHKNTQ